MSLFRSRRDIDFVKAINGELMIRVVGEKLLYFAFSKRFNSTNFYGESKEKVFDPPLEIYAFIQWQDQDTTTTSFGQDIVYNIQVDFLNQHLEDINITPKEGDCVEYDGKKFEIVQLTSPRLTFGKSGQDLGTRAICKSIRESSFKSSLSSSIDQPKRTTPEDIYDPTFGDDLYPYSGSNSY